MEALNAMYKTSKRIKRLILACLCGCLPLSALPETVVIYDSGNTRPTGIHLKKHRIQLSELPGAPDIGKLGMTQYPVTVTKLSLGPVEPQTIKLPVGFHPVFIAGSDALSREWLRLNHDRLLELRAVGILTEVENEEKLQELRQQFPRLPLMPMSADAIADYLPVRHYPLLITRDRIEQ
jgi:integrating conjugative element protein (TIGR03765 family)